MHIYIADASHEEAPAQATHQRAFTIAELWDDMDLDDEFQGCENVRDAEALVVWFFVVAGEERAGCCWVEPCVEKGVVRRLMGVGRRGMEERVRVVKVDIRGD